MIDRRGSAARAVHTRSIRPRGTICKQGSFIRGLIFLSVLEGLLLNLLTICLQLAISPFGLEDLDLAAGGVDVFDILPLLVRAKRIDLDPEGHPFLPAMLPGCELSADAVYLDEH